MFSPHRKSGAARSQQPAYFLGALRTNHFDAQAAQHRTRFLISETSAGPVQTIEPNEIALSVDQFQVNMTELAALRDRFERQQLAEVCNTCIAVSVDSSRSILFFFSVSAAQDVMFLREFEQQQQQLQQLQQQQQHQPHSHSHSPITPVSPLLSLASAFASPQQGAPCHHHDDDDHVDASSSSSGSRKSRKSSRPAKKARR